MYALNCIELVQLINSIKFLNSLLIGINFVKLIAIIRLHTEKSQMKFKNYGI